MSGSQQLILGEGAGGVVANYIEDVFSTWLYTGNGSTQTITNGIDLSTKGGLVWMKDRSTSFSHALFDTARGGTSVLATNLNDGASPFGSISGITFNSNGFYLPDNNSYGWTNTNNTNYVSWTFRKQPKFFDVVTYTGNGVSGRSISHNLGSVPGCIIVKRTDQAADWAVYHRGVNGGVNPQNYKLLLNLTNAQALDNWWNDSAPTSTAFQVSSDPTVNDGATGATYVAYLFAHDAGGFGLTGTDNVISCGSFTTDSGGAASVTLGYEPQWVMTKNSSGTSAWRMFDTMRGLTVAGQNDALLQANSSAAEITNSDYCSPTATGFQIAGHDGSATHIYIAIRRGPMKTPTTGTSVFTPFADGTNNTPSYTTSYPPDMCLAGLRTGSDKWFLADRLRASTRLNTASTAAQGAVTDGYEMFQTGAFSSYWSGYNSWVFRRAPGFFDVVCYTGTGSNRTVSHNLGVVPELMLVKRRDTTSNWTVYSATLANTEYIFLNSNGTKLTGTTRWNSTTPTSSVFTVGTDTGVNDSGGTYVAYLFASVAGVSKIGSYTGNGTSQTIDCGFTGGTRFVLIKKTSGNGNWWVWDSARGIVAGNDPYLALNTTSAEVTTRDSVDTDSSGFIVNDDLGTGINVNGDTYLFLAIA